MIKTAAALLAELAILELKALVRKRRDAEAKARQWAETPAPVRGCAKCGEVAYTPGQSACFKCGGPLR